MSGIAIVWCQLPEELSAAAAAAGPAVPVDHRAARADGLPDPALAGDDQLGGPAGGRVPEPRGATSAATGRRTGWSTALLTFGLILQQAAFPTLARLWRQTACAGREALDSLVEVLVTGLVPVAVGCTVLADPLVHLFLHTDYAGAGFLLALGIWRAPLLILAYLYQTTLIALNRETVGVRSLVAAAVVHRAAGGRAAADVRAAGAAVGVLLVGLALVVTGYGCLAREGRQPAWHHHLAPAARGVAGHGAGLPGAPAVSRAAGGRRRRGDVYRHVAGPRRTGSHAALADGAAAVGPGRCAAPEAEPRAVARPHPGLDATGGRR